MIAHHCHRQVDFGEVQPRTKSRGLDRRIPLVEWAVIERKGCEVAQRLDPVPEQQPSGRRPPGLAFCQPECCPSRTPAGLTADARHGVEAGCAVDARSASFPLPLPAGRCVRVLRQADRTCGARFVLSAAFAPPNCRQPKSGVSTLALGWARREVRHPGQRHAPAALRRTPPSRSARHPGAHPGGWPRRALPERPRAAP